jgi:catechol 2,3-dioxygenase-like lactoylglutathione lyase family enzyme
MLFSNIDAQPNLPVKDLEAARRFYEGVLELEPAGPAEQPGVQGYKAGSVTLLVYESAHAGTNKATAVSFPLGGGFDEAVEELRAKGVAFERYDMFEGSEEEGGVYTTSGGMKVAWFKDPDGNIINIGNY